MAVTLGNARLCQNRLLARLADEHYEALLPSFELVHNDIRETLHERDRPIPYVYFPCNCAHSCTIVLENGSMVEVGTIGNEGFSGVELLLKGEAATETVICQIPGESIRMGAADFLDAVNGQTPLRRITECYFLGYLSQVSQSVACNRMHTIEERFARWLLVSHDRVRNEEFLLTQEFVATMLGVHRPSVSMVAAAFQKTGLIEYSRGRMKILDRPGLEHMSCECYAAVRAQFRRVLGTDYG
jgi:CRP-like cAMP-binding protein